MNSRTEGVVTRGAREREAVEKRNDSEQVCALKHSRLFLLSPACLVCRGLAFEVRMRYSTLVKLAGRGQR